jgi:hypothetical protein
MNPAKLRTLCVAALVAALLTSVPAEAKRRAVGVRGIGGPAQDQIIGVITDAVTGLPVIGMTINAGFRSASTDENGRFSIDRLDTTKPISIDTDRSGYLPFQTTVQPGQSRNLTIRVTPTPTVLVRLTNGQTLQLDNESVKFGYPVPFSGYRESPAEDFCKTSDGTKVNLNKSVMKRLAGPAQFVSAGNCCDAGSAAKMSLTLRTGETFDVIFVDTCEERYKVDVGGRNHVTGLFEHVLLTDIVEVVFP